MSNKKHDFENIILIIADTLRQINLEDGNRLRAKTPNIDFLKENGVSFTNAYTTITKTDPSITAIMTGKYPIHNGLINHGELIRPKEEKNMQMAQTLSEVLHEHGYKTAAVDWLGRWHKKGFNYYSGRLGRFKKRNFRFESNPLVFLLYDLRKLTVRLVKREFFLRFYYCFFNKTNIPYDTADKVVEKGIEVLEKERNNKLFLYLHFWDPHEPHVKPRGIRSYLFDNVDDTYNAEIEFLDSQIGVLIQYLKESNQLEDTLIIFTADHGENFYESGSPFYHDMLYENVVKIPLVFSNTNLSKKEVYNLVQNIDIFPTLLHMLHIKINKELDGVNVFNLINKKNNEVRSFAYFEDILKDRRFKFIKKTRRRGIIIGTYKYIETISGTKNQLTDFILSDKTVLIRKELYNLKYDPHEKNDLILKKKKIADDLSSKLNVITKKLYEKNLIGTTKRGMGNLVSNKEKEEILSSLQSLGY